jgi:DNA-binding IclR family transcriptional regulator
MATEDGPSAPQSQTLDRGLRILEHLAGAGTPLQIAEIASSVGLHRSIAYRLLRTLEDHELVERNNLGQYSLGLGVAVLARGIRASLQSAALPRLNALAEELRMTAFLVVRAGEEAVTVTSVEPHDSPAHVTYRPGTRHPVGRGAPGLALLMPEPPDPGDRPELQRARKVGWATSRGEVIPGLRSVAVPVLGPDGGALAAIAVVYVDDTADVDQIGRAVTDAAGKVSAVLR